MATHTVQMLVSVPRGYESLDESLDTNDLILAKQSGCGVWGPWDQRELTSLVLECVMLPHTDLVQIWGPLGLIVPAGRAGDSSGQRTFAQMYLVHQLCPFLA